MSPDHFRRVATVAVALGFLAAHGDGAERGPATAESDSAGGEILSYSHGGSATPGAGLGDRPFPRRRAWLDRWRGQPTFDLFEPDGAYRGSVVLPARFVPMTVVGDTVFGVLHDELDVEYVVALTARARGPDAER